MRELNLEHKALLYILENVEGLKNRIKSIYDLDTNTLKLDYLDQEQGFNLNKLGLSSGEETILRSAISLYNGTDKITLLDSFISLDNSNREILINAIKIRFNL